MNTRAAPRRTTWVAAALIIACGVAAYHAVLPYPFIYDDEPAIQQNQHIRSLFDPPSALRAPPFSPPDGRPLVAVSLALNYAVGGLAPAGYRAVNVLIHLLAALVLFGIVRRTLRRPALEPTFGAAADALAALVAMMWVAHPLQPESVTYVSQRTASLAGLLYLCTLYCVIRSQDAPRRRLWASLAVASCALGLLSKEIVATAPVVVMLYIWAFADGSRVAALRRNAGLLLALFAMWAIPIYLLGPWSPYAQRVVFSGTTPPPPEHAPQGSAAFNYALNQCWVLVDYAWHAVWPANLVIDYGFPKQLGIGDVWLAGVLVVGAVIGTLVLFAIRPAIGFPLLAALMILAPTSSVVPIYTEVGAERRMYLPVAGILAMIVIGGFALLRKGQSDVRRVAAGLAVVAVVALVVRTVVRNRDFSSAVACWTSAVEATPDNYRAHLNLGAAHLFASMSARGPALVEHRTQAEAALKHTLEVRSSTTEAAANLGFLLKSQGRIDEAIRYYEMATKDRPRAMIDADLCGLYTQRGRLDDARRVGSRALEAEPNNPTALVNVGVLVGMEGDGIDALPYFRKAIAAKPDYAPAHANLGMVLSRKGYLDAARMHLERGLQHNVHVVRELAWLLATHPDPSKRDPRRALELAAHAVTVIGHPDMGALDALAAAHAAAGNYVEAVRVIESSLRLARPGVNEPFVRAVRERLRTYRASSPWVSRNLPGPPP